MRGGRRGRGRGGRRKRCQIKGKGGGNGQRVGSGTEQGKTHPLVSKSIAIASSDAKLPAPAEAGVGAADGTFCSWALVGGCGLITAMKGRGGRRGIYRNSERSIKQDPKTTY